MKLALLAALVGCVEPSLLSCPDSGLLCPTGDVCDTVHHICIAPEQQVPCVGMPDEAVCAVAGAPGYCRDQICLLPVCGNHYVDHGEACDDGNAVSGDGCNALCTSTEQCGNGFIDPSEACDDGDRISGDGCDSQCHAEAFTWQPIGIVPRYETGAHHAVYDPVRGQIVLVADDVTWTWNGSAWKVLAIGGIPGDTLQAGWGWHQLVWDDDRQSVILVGTIVGNAVDQIWEWNGAQWTRIVSATAPMLLPGEAVYDVARKRVVVVGVPSAAVSEAWTLDVASATWTKIASPPVATLANGYAFAYDKKRNVAVLGAAQSSFISMTEWNGATWSPVINGGLTVNAGVTFAWDPIANQLLSIGGRVDAGTVSTQVAGWDGAQWGPRPAVEQLTVPKALPEVVVDQARNVRVVWGGSTGTLETSSVYELTGAWAGPLGVYPPEFQQVAQDFTYAYDTGHRRIVVLGSPVQSDKTDLWGWNGAWHQLAPCPLDAKFYPAPPAIGYDPERDAIVTVGPDQTTYLFHLDAWTTLPTSAPLDGTTAITYDPVEHGMVALDGHGTWLLPSAGTTWQRIADLPSPGGYPSMAFDARTDQIVDIDLSSTSVLVDHTHWEHTLSPGPSYDVVANARRGSVEFFTPEGSIYERFAGQFVSEDPAKLPPPPAGLTAQGHDAVYAPELGAVYLIGDLRYSRMILRRTATSVLDACTGGDDDGDGLVDCDDPDCWWSCMPACPPHTSC